MRFSILGGALAAALMAATPAFAAGAEKPALAKQQGDARAAFAAINAISAEDEWAMLGRDYALQIVSQSSPASVEAAAATGDARAQWAWGHVLYFGLGVENNEAEAARMWLLAAQQGHPRAQNDIAWMYDNGRGVAQDFVQAARWYREAVNQEHAGAANDLGLMYEEGRGVAQDFAEARRLYELGEEGGNELAAYNLGLMYERGTGVAVDVAEAMRHYGIAAEWGHTPSQERLDYLRSLTGAGRRK